MSQKPRAKAIEGLPLMAALAALKKRDPAGYKKLLADVGVDEFSALDVSRFPQGTLATCRAMLEKPAPQEEKLSTRDALNAMALGDPMPNAFAELIEDAPTLAAKLDLIGKAALLKAKNV